MPVLMVQFSVEPADVAEFDSLLEQMCTALEDERPPGARFAACRLADGATFLTVLQLDEDTPNPLPGIEAARAFQQRMAARALVGRTRPAEPVTVLGSYRLF